MLLIRLRHLQTGTFARGLQRPSQNHPFLAELTSFSEFPTVYTVCFVVLIAEKKMVNLEGGIILWTKKCDVKGYRWARVFAVSSQGYM